MGVSSVNGITAGLPLSRVSVLMEHRWHKDFDESRLDYLAEDGSRVEVADLQQLVRLLLEWRAQRVKWQLANGSIKCAAMDEALSCELELVVGDNPSDPTLRRCDSAGTGTPEVSAQRLVSTAAPAIIDLSTRKFSDAGSPCKVGEAMSARKSFGMASRKAVDPVTEKDRPALRSFHHSFIVRDASPVKTAARALGDRRAVPAGIVQRLRSRIECSAK